MTKNELKSLVLKTLHDAKGDDLYRAWAAFKYYTPEQMNKEWGQSGRTCQQIVDGYKEHEDQISEAIAWISSLEVE